MKKSNLLHSYYAVNSVDGIIIKKLKKVVSRFDLIKNWLTDIMFSTHTMFNLQYHYAK